MKVSRKIIGGIQTSVHDSAAAESLPAGQLLRQQMHTDSDKSPEGSYEQEGEEQSLRERQAGSNLSGAPWRIVRVVSPLELRKPVETPHSLATIQ
jgi:hypothetical protein